MSDLDHTYCSRCNTTTHTPDRHSPDVCADKLRKQLDSERERVRELKDQLLKKDLEGLELFKGHTYDLERKIKDLESRLKEKEVNIADGSFFGFKTAQDFQDEIVRLRISNGGYVDGIKLFESRLKELENYPLQVRAEKAEVENNRLILCLSKLTEENERLKKGENDWWQKRWVNNDVGVQLEEIRKKWLTAFECAENWQKMYEEIKSQLQTIPALDKAKDAVIYAVGDYASNYKDDRFGSRRRLLEAYAVLEAMKEKK